MADNRADGVTYYRIDGFGRDMFRCTTWRANMSVPACAKRWQDAQSAKGEQAEKLRLCMLCPIGAAHAGERQAYRAPNYLDNRCPRCRRGTMRRLIGGRLDISCYNREREWLVGQNAKGTSPVRLNERLRVLSIGVIVDPGESTERRTVFRDIAIDEEEMKIRVGRLHVGRVEFIPAGDYPEWTPEGATPLRQILAKHPHRARELLGQTANTEAVPPTVPIYRMSPVRRAVLSASALTPVPWAVRIARLGATPFARAA